MSKHENEQNSNATSPTPLKRGWTTGACATAATKSALYALLQGEFIDPVSIHLPKGDTPSFPLAQEDKGDGYASAGIIKDAGDDPDVTHSATIISHVEKNEVGKGITFHAGNGVGTVTKKGLPIDVGEAAINPVPRQLMREVVEEACKTFGIAPDIKITISVPNGEELAKHTWNGRLGILGGISILGTTGVVHPFSCSAWIHSIHRGIDVSRASGLTHVMGATGSTSEAAACELYDFEDEAMLDMGDFVGGVLKYMRDNPIPKLTLSGGFAKFCKLARGAMDLHSGRSQVDFEWLANEAALLGCKDEIQTQIKNANTAKEALEITSSTMNLPNHIAKLAQQQALKTLRGAPIEVEVLIVDREGNLLARTDWQ